MKGQKSILIFILAIVSLLGIGVVLATGFFKNKPQQPKTTEEQKVLGELSEKNATPTPALDINKFVAESFQSTKEAAGQKVIEVQKTIVNTVEKEVSSLAQSQVVNLKQQICRDWGIVSSSPTKTP